MTDYLDWQTPQAHADRIFATTVPLASKSNNVVNDQLHNIPFGATVTIANQVPVNQIGYEISVKALISAAASSLPILTVEMKWTDSVTGTIVADEVWNIVAGSTQGGSLHYGTGPSKANLLTINVTNNDTSQAMTVTTVLNQNSRVYVRDDWRTQAFNSVPNASIPQHNQQGNILGASLITVGALGTFTRLLALYSGLVTVTYASATSAAGKFQITPLDPAIANGVFYLDAVAASNLTKAVLLALPRCACTFTMTDTSNGTNSLEAFFHIAEQLA